jgi:hypothetical protein
MNVRRAAGACLLILLAAAGCREADPLATRLAQRSHYQVDVVGFSPRDDGRLLVELEARAGMGEHLNRLTATIRQHGTGEEILASNRITLDLAGMDATGVVRVYAEVVAYQGEIQGVSALVERTPPASEYDQFPEILEVAGP